MKRMYASICMYAYMLHECIHISMHVRTYVRMYVRMYVCNIMYCPAIIFSFVVIFDFIPNELPSGYT